MIDYLEALLEEENEETGEELLPGRRVPARAAAGVSSVPSDDGTGEDRGGDEAFPLAEPAERETGLRLQTAAPVRQTAWPERTVLPRREPGESAEEEGAGAPLPELLQWERQAAEAALLLPAARAETEGAALYEALRRAAQTARAGRMGPGTVSLTLPDRAAPAPGLTITDIDRAVQRDARRFDGGFTLY